MMKLWYSFIFLIILSWIICYFLAGAKTFKFLPGRLRRTGWGVLFVSMLILTVQYREFRQYQQIAAWPVVWARIDSARIIGERAVRPRFTYVYRVGDSLYRGWTDLGIPPFGARNKRALTARRAIAEHPVGDSLKVSYDPQKPWISTTSNHLPWNYYMKIGFGLFLHFLAAALLLKKNG